MKLSQTLLVLICFISSFASEETCVFEDSTAGMAMLLTRTASRTPSPVPQESIGTKSTTSSSSESLLNEKTAITLKSILKKPKTSGKAAEKTVMIDEKLNKVKEFERYHKPSDFYAEASGTGDENEIRMTEKPKVPLLTFSEFKFAAIKQKHLATNLPCIQEISGSDDEKDDNINISKSVTAMSFLPAFPPR